MIYMHFEITVNKEEQKLVFTGYEDMSKEKVLTTGRTKYSEKSFDEMIERENLDKKINKFVKMYEKYTKNKVPFVTAKLAI